MSDTYTRGALRLQPDRLPCIDSHAEIHYAGSISKAGDNADYDWAMYQDENGEWVLMEADGAGCIFNFTQHRYSTSPVPVFRFYFDNSPVPQFEITPAEFGSKPPFLKPFADAFYGPEDNGNGPIRVVRSFVPMEFRTHCKVTSSLRLTGYSQARGEGGWGHIIYQTYDSAEGLSTFKPSVDMDAVVKQYQKSIRLPAQAEAKKYDFTLAAGEKLTVPFKGRQTITSVSAITDKFAPEQLAALWISLTFDGQKTTEAPFGTFFGCEYGKTPADIQTALLTSNFAGAQGIFENRFPMPFFSSAEVTLENRGEATVSFTAFSVGTNKTLNYNPAETGYFSSSPYYAKRANIPGKNSVIASVSGCGHMAYAVLSGEEINNGGCEGDVRVFPDDISSPQVESDGSESFASYGWGFVFPPQCNPFSAYNGVPYCNHTWSEVRLTFTDSYPFRSSLRFELEHGGANDGGGFHSGQIFCYMKSIPCEELLAEITPDSSSYKTDGTSAPVTDRFENGIHENYHDFTAVRNMSFSEFTVAVPPENDGIMLKRVFLQDNGRMCAVVEADGIKVTERRWLFPDHNDIFRLREDYFLIPAAYTRGKHSITVTLRPEAGKWTECRYRVFALTDKTTLRK